MEIDDLKRAWEEQSRKLDARLRLNTRLLHDSVLGKAGTAMTRLSWLLAGELLLDLLLAVWLGWFIAGHVREPRFLVPAVVLHLGAIGLVISCIRQLEAIRSIDYGAPILAIQKRLGTLRLQRVRATQWTLLSAPLLWILVLIVALKGLLGLDAYAIFDEAWLAANVLLGVAVIPLAIWMARRHADRMERSPLVQRLLRDLAGYNLNAATGFLDSLARFEAEETPAIG